MMNDKINLKCKEGTPFPELKHNQVVLNFAKIRTGEILKPNKEIYLGEGNIYQVFDSIEEAKKYARNIVQEDAEIECWILTGKEKAVCYVNKFEEKDFS